MARLPDAVHERLLSEYQYATAKILESSDQTSKLYYFSVFFGEAGRQLNIHWDSDLALLFIVTQTVASQIPVHAAVPAIGMAAGTLLPEFLPVIDEVSQRITGAFATPEIDAGALHAALTRAAELLYATTGNGAYLYSKGMIRF